MKRASGRPPPADQSFTRTKAIRKILNARLTIHRCLGERTETSTQRYRSNTARLRQYRDLALSHMGKIRMRETSDLVSFARRGRTCRFGPPQRRPLSDLAGTVASNPGCWTSRLLVPGPASLAKLPRDSAPEAARRPRTLKGLSASGGSKEGDRFPIARLSYMSKAPGAQARQRFKISAL